MERRAASSSVDDESRPSIGAGFPMGVSPRSAVAMHYTHPFMRKPVPHDSPARAIVDDEVGMLRRVHALLARDGEPVQGGSTASDFERDLIALRDQLADEKPEDLPSLVEQMTRVSALAAGRRGGKAALP